MTVTIEDLAGRPVSATTRKVKGPTILLYSGSYFDFLDPASSEITIEDIAQGLSQICRFAAQCQRFYSVAEHCLHVSWLVPPEHAYAALMHDAAEAVVGDVSKPLKDLIPEYRVIEKHVEAAIFARFGVPTPLPPCIKEADIVMLATEQREVMRNNDGWDYTRGRTPLDMRLPCWSPEEAKAHFLERYATLRSAA